MQIDDLPVWALEWGRIRSGAVPGERLPLYVAERGWTSARGRVAWTGPASRPSGRTNGVVLRLDPAGPLEAVWRHSNRYSVWCQHGNDACASAKGLTKQSRECNLSSSRRMWKDVAPVWD